MTKLSGWKVVVLTCALITASAEYSLGQVFTTLVYFQGRNGYYPVGSLAQGFDGNLYGTTTNGGIHQAGNVFKVTPDGTLTQLYDFCAQAGCPNTPGGYLLPDNGFFYGTTSPEFVAGENTVFKITAEGVPTILHTFTGPDGVFPNGLTFGSDGYIYGTTYGGGNSPYGGGGTAFKISPSGNLTTLYNFCSQPNCSDGSFPLAALVQGSDGDYYGTTMGPTKQAMARSSKLLPRVF